MIRKKAKEILRQRYPSSTTHVQLNWVSNFLRRHGIEVNHELNSLAKNMGAAQSITKYFFEKYNEFIEGNKYKEMWTYDEILIALDPKIIHTVDLLYFFNLLFLNK